MGLEDGNSMVFPNVPLSCVLQYEKNMDNLLEMVNEELQSKQGMVYSMRGNQSELMAENHRNHLIFMIGAMKFNNQDLLHKNMAWAYRSYQARGFLPAYFLEVNRAFYTAVNSYLHQEDAEPILRLYDWMKAQHQALIAQTGTADVLTDPVDLSWEDTRSRFTAALLSGDTHQPLKLAQTQVTRRDRLSGFYLQVIQPALIEVGNLWEAGEISVAQEHLSSAIVTRVMASLYPRFIMLEQSKGKAIVTAAPNEFHEIGPRMVADLLEVDGWDVDYYGANVPAEDLVTEAASSQPFFIALSVSMAFNLDKADRLIKMIRANQELKDVRIMLGGRCFNEYPQLTNELNGDGYSPDAGSAVLLAEKWWQNA